ncbi:MAG: aspartate kinase [Fibrobacterota bacterium]
MEHIVCKFGGSSVATRQRIEQVASIIEENPRRRCIVLSAPGKAPGIDVKVTDMLLAISRKSLEEEDISAEVAAVRKRYHDIYKPLGVGESGVEEVLNILDRRIQADKTDPLRYRDSLVASGEDLNARLFAKYLTIRGNDACYLSPQEANLLVTSSFGDAQPLNKTTKNLKILKKLITEKIVVFPGFFGVTKDGHIATFSRGGSDLTGALLAEAIDAGEYENFTDVNGIFSANPTIVESPEQIPALTYKEMRELSYIGFNVLHEEAVKPVMFKMIPIRLRNTNNLKNDGTLIVAERLPSERDVIGIASGGRYCSFTLQKFLMNREKGFGRRLLAIFEDLNLSFEHCPSGVDNISVILDQTQLKPGSANAVIRTIEKELSPDFIKTEFDLSLIAVVGEGLIQKVGLLSQAAQALANAGVNIKMVNQGSSEISVIFGIDAEDESEAVNALYKEFFS